MAYTPINWQTGDTITAEKMNKMDNGWGVETSGGVLFNETVVTEKDPSYPEEPAFGELQYSEQITADTVTITFNNVEYVCSRQDGDPGSFVYGGWVDGEFDFSTFPFVIFSESGINEIATDNEGTFTIKAEATTSAIEVSDSFSQACNACVDTSTMPMLCVSGVTTNAEMATAFGHGSLLFFRPYPNIRASYIITRFDSEEAHFIPEDSGVSATFENDVFTVTILI